MKKRLSVVVITKNAERLLAKSLDSVKNIADEIVLVDSESTDNTLEIAKQFSARIFKLKTENLGLQKEFGVKKAKYKWILILDSDEVVSPKLSSEIAKTISKKTKFYGFKVPYQNFLFGKPINYGGENYSKLILFQKKFGEIKHVLVHENYNVKNYNSGRLRNKMYHYSYSSLLQMYRKFTNYALSEATQKFLDQEKSSLKKIVAYPIHMFWARYIKSKGYKDGVVRIVLDLGFAYMEFLTYVALFFKTTFDD